jgi:hypothetical protein
MNLTGDEVAEPGLQERMSRELIHQAGYDDYLAGRKTAAEVQQRLAGVWSSLPADSSGYSAYMRNGKKVTARVSPVEVQAALRAGKAEYDAYVQQMLEDGRMPDAPGGWRADPKSTLPQR